MQELNLPDANYEFAASTARPTLVTLHFSLIRLNSLCLPSVTPMKINSTVALTLSLLALMFGAGVVSAAWGLVVGREALKGITQPDTRPTNPTAQNAPRKEEVVILQEEALIAAAKARMSGAASSGAPAAIASPSPAITKVVNKVAAVKLPISVQTFGVFLEVESVKQQGDMLLMKVNLKNTGEAAVRFVYNDSFLSVNDDKGAVIPATAQGLPAELPPTGELFSGTVTVPAELVEQAGRLTLGLADYPNQRVQLQLPNIPVGHQ